MLFGASVIQDKAASIKRWLEYRWQRVKRLPWMVLAILLGVAVISSLEGLRDPELGLTELWLNLGTELAGAVVTFVLIDLVLGARQRKEAVITQMGSDVRDVAVPAVDDLRREGWLKDGSLVGAELVGARLQGANLTGAHLQKANFTLARLQGASLWLARLQGANLEFARLEGAVLIEANLEGAVLADANLEGARLTEANLTGASLERANLQDARLTEANLRGVNLAEANLLGARLTDADLGGAKLGGANLLSANLEGAFVSFEQLAKAVSLRGVTLPDGTKLSEDNWEAEFEEWRNKQEEQEGNE
jgi:uncharacterized protein YjbI with pentapeptide repeats